MRPSTADLGFRRWPGRHGLAAAGAGAAATRGRRPAGHASCVADSWGGAAATATTAAAAAAAPATAAAAGQTRSQLDRRRKRTGWTWS